MTRRKHNGLRVFSPMTNLVLLCLVLALFECNQCLKGEVDVHEQNPNDLNNTRFANTKVLIFNRVPKAGSRLIKAILYKLAKVNSFKVWIPNEVPQVRPSNSQENLLGRILEEYDSPVAAIKHFTFLNFTRHGYAMPIYINMVRDPVERVISWFHYIRTPQWRALVKRLSPGKPDPTPRWMNKDFESCVLRGDSECSFIAGKVCFNNAFSVSQTKFLCGNSETCFVLNGEEALQKAKENVERYYSVVGVLEEMDMTIEVLEKYVPKFFAGASRIYYGNKKAGKKVNENRDKPIVSEKIKNMLRQNFTREIEFHKFCKQRLHSQYAALHSAKRLE